MSDPDDDRDEDEEDAPDDQAIKRARNYAPMAVFYLISVLENREESTADRLKAADLLLGVAGCL